MFNFNWHFLKFKVTLPLIEKLIETELQPYSSQNLKIFSSLSYLTNKSSESSHLRTWNLWIFGIFDWKVMKPISWNSCWFMFCQSTKIVSKPIIISMSIWDKEKYERIFLGIVWLLWLYITVITMHEWHLRFPSNETWINSKPYLINCHWKTVKSTKVLHLTFLAGFHWNHSCFSDYFGQFVVYLTQRQSRRGHEGRRANSPEPPACLPFPAFNSHFGNKKKILVIMRQAVIFSDTEDVNSPSSISEPQLQPHTQSNYRPCL